MYVEKLFPCGLNVLKISLNLVIQTNNFQLILNERLYFSES